jgi:hypothetical protein
VRVEPHTHVLVVDLVRVGRAGRDGGGSRGRQVHRGVLEVEGHQQSLPVRADLVDQLGVGQVQRLGSGVVQPGVAAAYPDQLLVQPVDAPAVRGELPWGVGEDGADGVVTARSMLHDTTEPCSSPA